MTAVQHTLGGKGARLIGGALTSEAVESSPSVLRAAGVFHAKGLQQH